MTWISTWPMSGSTHYAEHETEAEAENHAVRMRGTNGTNGCATWYEALEMVSEPPTIGAVGDCRREVAPVATDDVNGSQIGETA